ncbi:hypothetical protein [Sphingomonas nostoxanthinifaciens]|uniref:hypothetical protein n=1 Tax=Sphingomonas nostoxanthinifaciens TaxID=2872652 RepID=UPI001CC205C8|nr:hypothetical protein [Sphingomonas nostoxanthinifaciens]UAK23295.1 hypothetical protein K8P63_12885 [Sphingomonas nostoxanthinifaciens]
MTAAPARVEIGTLVVSAASHGEGQRLADALPAAIERALAAGTDMPRAALRLDAGEVRGGATVAGIADQVAQRIVAAMAGGRP